MDLPTVTSFALYFIVMVAIGFVAWRKTRTISDFVLGGRSLGPVVTALSAGASGMSGWLLLALPGAFYLLGLNQIWMVIGLSIGAETPEEIALAALAEIRAVLGERSAGFLRDARTPLHDWPQ